VHCQGFERGPLSFGDHLDGAVDGSLPASRCRRRRRAAVIRQRVDLGRHSVNNDGDRTTLIFDRTTYQVMGRAVEVHDGRTDSEAVLATGLVEKAGQTP
jgi:hypothetical protein